MNFPFRTAKAAEVASAFIERANGSLNVMKLVKLIYLLDRRSIDQRGIPVVGGGYFSMKNGPVISEVLDLINDGRLRTEQDDAWEKHISARQNHTVSLISAVERWHVSDNEMKLIDEIWQEHGDKDQWQLSDWCHENCVEWTELSGGNRPITLGGLTAALGKSEDQYVHIEREAEELEMLSKIFA